METLLCVECGFLHKITILTFTKRFNEPLDYGVALSHHEYLIILLHVIIQYLTSRQVYMLEEPGKKTTAEVDIRNACFRRRKTCEMHEITLVSWAKEKKNCMK
jgi:hypothetical protein